jgi:hypothetical protein
VNLITSLIAQELEVHSNIDNEFNQLQLNGIELIEQFEDFQDLIETASTIHNQIVDERENLILLTLEAGNFNNINLDKVHYEINVAGVAQEINYTLDFSGRSLNQLVQLMKQLITSEIEISNKNEIELILNEWDTIYPKKRTTTTSHLCRHVHKFL